MKDYQLIEIACKVSGISIKDIASTSRVQEIMDARFLAFALLHKYTRLTDERIGMLFNVKDKSVYYGIQKVKTALDIYQIAGITSNLTKICLKSKELTTKLIQYENYHMGTVTPSNGLYDWNSNFVFDTVAVNP